MQIYANPTRFLYLANRLLPFCWALTLLLLSIGLYGALFASPADYQQGENVRIIYVHVPAAWMALFVYGFMAFASLVAYIFNHPLADAAAKVAAPLGAMFCFLALTTGALWGRPMWGAWWVWDARLTSMFVLFLLYLGYIAVWQAFEDPLLGAPTARLVALIGVIDVPIVKFSVDWWNSLHQPASILRWQGPALAPSMLWPLLVMALAYLCLFLSLEMLSLRSELAMRKIRNLQIAKINISSTDPRKVRNG